MRGRNSAPGGGTYTALGGSNTCDHPPQKVGYQTLVFQELRRRGLVSEHQNSCIHAMGPAFAASCMPYFVSKNTTFATLEYVPNMGVQTQLHADHLGLLLTRLQRRHVNVALVNIVPPDSRMRHFGDAHARVSSLARSLSVPVITVEYRNDTSMWKREERVVRHITDEAQRTVAARVVSVLVEQQSWRRRGRSTASAASIASQASCLFGRDLARARVLDSSGFELRPEADHKGLPGFVALTPNASMRVCLRRLPPSFLAAFAMEQSDWRPMDNVSFSCEGGCRCEPSTFVGRGALKATQNWLHRVRGTRTRGGREPAQGRCSCVIVLQNTRRPAGGAQGPARARLNGLVAGGESTAEWSNTYHLGFLRNRGHFSASPAPGPTV